MANPGRKIIWTDESEITYENVIDVLRDAILVHTANAQRIQFLLDYDGGDQPIIRKNPKTYRPDIDCRCNDNVAHQVSNFWTGFGWGNAITLVQNGDGKDQYVSDGISELNKQYDLVKIRAKTQELGRFVEIGALCYVYVDTNMNWREGKSYFTLDILDPRTSFVIRSNYYPDKRVMLGVTYRCDKRGIKHYTCFTPDARYEISEWKHAERSGELNPLGMIPIVEYIRSYDRMGVWEHQISEMDNLNLLISDFSNDVEQNTQAVWHANDVDFPVKHEVIEEKDGTKKSVEEVVKPKSGEWLNTFTSPDGKTPFVKALSIDYDYDGMLNAIQYRRNKILEKCNVPLTSDNASNITGVAASNASGWDHAEAAASKQQMITESCKLEEVEVVLAAIVNNPNLPADSPLKKITPADIEVNVKRQKLYELSTKVNSAVTLIKAGFDGGKILNTIPIFDDPNEVWDASKEMVRKIQNSGISQDANTGDDIEPEKPNSDRIMQDLSDQVTNSPLIDKSRAEK